MDHLKISLGKTLVCVIDSELLKLLQGICI